MTRFAFTLICLTAATVWAGTVKTVDDDGPADYSTIQQAINAAQTDDTILVEPGIYRENIRFMGKAIRLTSTDPENQAVVDQTVIAPAMGYAVMFDFGENATSILVGFTITGGGIYCSNSSPTISLCVIKDCPSIGVYCEYSAAPTIQASKITNCAGWGIASCYGAIKGNEISYNNGGLFKCNGPITDNLISDNHSNVNTSGGGLYDCGGRISGNTITNNSSTSDGGGLWRCAGEINNNVIVANRSVYTGGGLFHCQGTISHNIIAGNLTSGIGGGGGLYDCDGTISNNTIVGNRTFDKGAGLMNCSGFVRNNIIAYNEATQGGGIYGTTTSSYNVYWNNVGGSIAGGAKTGAGDIEAEPFFAAPGYWDPNGTGDTADDFWVDGDYHVRSEIGRWSWDTESWIKDAVTSPCIDAGDPTTSWKQEFWRHGTRVNVGVYGGTREASMSLSTVGDVADLNLDDLVDYKDLDLLVSLWLRSYALMRADLNRDGVVNFADFAILTSNWHTLPAEPGPPTPDPMTWATEPNATSETTIVMEATRAISTDGSSVEYSFLNTTLSDHSSGWITETTWVDSNLPPGSEFCYEVRARNTGNLLEAQWSQSRCATTVPLYPPNPNPITWAVEPYGTSESTISMTATTAASGDGGSVEYYFEDVDHPEYNSGWISETTWQDSGLSPASEYCYRVKARNSGNLVETQWSQTKCGTTLQAVPPSPNPMTWAAAPSAVSANSITMTASTATSSDGSVVEYLFTNTTVTGHNSGWQTSTTYTDTGLSGLTQYCYKVKARNRGNLAETGLSSELCATTPDPDLTPPSPNPMSWAVGGQPKKVHKEPFSSFDWYAEMTAKEATDSSGVEYMFICVSDGRFSSDWQDSPTYSKLIGQQAYYVTFYVIARDKSGNHNQTGPSSTLPWVN